jgi:hypothetical protein
MLHARFQDNGALHALGLMKGWSADAADFDECCLWVSEVQLPLEEHTFRLRRGKTSKASSRQASFVDEDAQNRPPASERKRNKLFEEFKTNLRLLHGTLCVSGHPLSENSPEWKF